MNASSVAAVAAALAAAFYPNILAMIPAGKKKEAGLDRSGWVNELFVLAGEATASGDTGVAEAAKALISALVALEPKNQ